MATGDPRGKKSSIVLVGVLAVVAAMLAFLWTAGGRRDDPSESAPKASSAGDISRESSGADEARDPGRAVDDGSRTDEQRAAATTTGARDSILTRPIRGKVIDARTREPVPFVDVRLIGGSVEDVVATGLDGAFQSSRELPANKLTAVVSDAGRTVQTLTRGADASADEVWTIELPIGPTYPLAIDARAPIEPAQWSARVIETTRNFDDAGEIDVDERGLHMGAPIADLDDRVWSWIPLRGEKAFAGDVAWLRYPSVEFEPDPRYRLRVQVRCDVLGRKGLARIRATVGVHEPVIVDALADVGTLSGRVVDASGDACAGATVLLCPMDIVRGADRTPQWAVVHANEKGEFRFVDLEPGRHTLVAFAPRQPVLVIQKYNVTSGAVELDEPLRLPKNAPRIDLEPATTSLANANARDSRRSGRENLYVHLRVPEASRYVSDFIQPISDAAIRESVALLDANRLPAAKLDLEWIDAFDSQSARQRPSVTPCVTRIADPSARLNARFGAPVQAFMLRFEVEGEPNASNLDLSFEPGGVLVGEQTSGDLRRWLFVPGSPLRWVVWRPGFEPQFGEEPMLVESKRRELTVRVPSIKGWGAVLWFRIADGASPLARKKLEGLGYSGGDSDAVPPMHEMLATPPLPGVRVLVDNTLAAESDGEGVVELARKSMPARIVLAADGWHMVRLERLPQHCASTLRYVVWMQRD